jgi:hypothetical protein
MKELYPGNLAPGAFRMGPDGVVYPVPGRGQRAPRMTGGLQPSPSPAVIPVPEDMRIRGSLRDLLKYLPQMPDVGGC